MLLIEKKDRRYKCTPNRKKCQETICVSTKLNPTAQRVYWFFRHVTENGDTRVAIKDSTLREIVKCSQRTLFTTIQLMRQWGIITQETVSHKGLARHYPRKRYRFKGIAAFEECKTKIEKRQTPCKLPSS